MMFVRNCRARGRVPPVAIALVLVVAVAGPVRAQTSRYESIAAAQAAKAAVVEPEGPNTAERVLVRIQQSPLIGGQGGVYPWLGTVYPGTGFAIGGGYLRRFPHGARVNLVAGASIAGSTLMSADVRFPEIVPGLLSVRATAHRTDARDVLFYGLGPGADRAARVTYDYQPTEVSITAELTPIAASTLGASYRRLDIEASVPSDAVAGDTPGLGLSLGYDVMEAQVAFDWRSSPGYSTRGGLYRATWSRFREREGHPFSFDRMEYEVSHLVPLLREQYVLAFRGLATVTRTDEGDRVPVVLTPFIGSGDTLRGFANRRFADRTRLLLTAEYRWRPSRFLDMAVFVDAGQVAPRLGDLRGARLRRSWGIGGRFHGPTFTVLRIELARGAEGVNLVVGASHAF